MGFLDATAGFFNSSGFQSVLSGLETGLGIASQLDELFTSPPKVSLPSLTVPINPAGNGIFGGSTSFPSGIQEPGGSAPPAEGSTASLLVVLAILALIVLVVLKFAG